MKRITLNQLEMLVAAVDHGGFSAASAELGCTQSRISHGIAELERQLGTRLLARSRSGCKPTNSGQRVVAQARDVLRLSAGILDGAREESALAGTVRVACIRSAATHLLPHVLEALARQYPDLHVDVQDGCHDYGDVVALLERGATQIGITRGPVGNHVVSRPYVSDRYVVIAPASTRLKSPVCWKELSRLQFIHIEQPGARWIVEQCRESGCLQQPVRHLVNECSVLALVARGLGYAVLPRLAVFPEMAGTQLLALPTPIVRHLALITRRCPVSDPCVDVVIRFLLDKALAMKTDAWRAGAFAFDY